MIERKCLGLDAGLVTELHAMVMRKYGFTRGAVKREAEKAIRRYLDEVKNE